MSWQPNSLHFSNNTIWWDTDKFMLDYYHVSDQFTDEERQTQAEVREFLEAEALPHIAVWWERAEFPRQLVPRLAELGLIGAKHARRVRRIGRWQLGVRTGDVRA